MPVHYINPKFFLHLVNIFKVRRVILLKSKIQRFAYIVIKTLGVDFMLDFQTVLLAISLSVDAFVIGISYGFRKIFVPLSSKIVITLISFVVTGLSIALGNAMLLFVPLEIAKILGPAMLFFLGVFTISKGFKKDPKNDSQVTRSNDNIFDITKKIIDDPEICDFNKSSKIDITESIYLGLALSVDSICSGISSAISGLSSFLLPVFVALFQFIFLSTGCFFAKKFSSIVLIDEKYFSLLAGSILIVLAAIRLFT